MLHLQILSCQFRLETEYGLRQNVEADINGLHPILDQMTHSASELEDEFVSLQEQTANLKKTHEEVTYLFIKIFPLLKTHKKPQHWHYNQERSSCRN